MFPVFVRDTVKLISWIQYSKSFHIIYAYNIIELFLYYSGFVCIPLEIVCCDLRGTSSAIVLSHGKCSVDRITFVQNIYFFKLLFQSLA
jgi:hypothetical protein